MPDIDPNENPQRAVALQHLRNSKRLYFRFRTREAILGLLTLPLSGILVYLMVTDAFLFQVWLGIGTAIFPLVIGIVMHSIIGLVKISRRKSRTSGKAVPAWKPAELQVLAREVHWLSHTRKWTTGLFLAGFALMIGGLIKGTPSLIMGVGIGLCVAGGILLSVFLMQEFHTREYTYRLKKI